MHSPEDDESECFEDNDELQGEQDRYDITTMHSAAAAADQPMLETKTEAPTDGREAKIASAAGAPDAVLAKYRKKLAPKKKLNYIDTHPMYVPKTLNTRGLRTDGFSLDRKGPRKPRLTMDGKQREKKEVCICAFVYVCRCFCPDRLK